MKQQIRVIEQLEKRYWDRAMAAVFLKRAAPELKKYGFTLKTVGSIGEKARGSSKKDVDFKVTYKPAFSGPTLNIKGQRDLLRDAVMRIPGVVYQFPGGFSRKLGYMVTVLTKDDKMVDFFLGKA